MIRIRSYHEFSGWLVVKYEIVNILSAVIKFVFLTYQHGVPFKLKVSNRKLLYVVGAFALWLPLRLGG
jgi:hypothetical protein